MLRTYMEMQDFRNNCVCHNRFDYYEAYEEILHEITDWDESDVLYNQIEKSLLDWIKKNAESDVYYRGDLQFEFESEDERAQFDSQNGDPVAFKLTWT